MKAYLTVETYSKEPKKHWWNSRETITSHVPVTILGLKTYGSGYSSVEGYLVRMSNGKTKEVGRSELFFPTKLSS